MVKIKNLKDVPSLTVVEVRHTSNDEVTGLVVVVPNKGENQLLSIGNSYPYDKKQVYYTPVINLGSPNIQDWPEEIYRSVLQHKISSRKPMGFLQSNVDSIDKLVDYFKRCPGRVQASPLTPSAKRRLRRDPKLKRGLFNGNCYAIAAGHHYIPSEFGDLYMPTISSPAINAINTPTVTPVVLDGTALSSYAFSYNKTRYCEYKDQIFNKSCQLSDPLIVTTMLEIPVNDGVPIAPGYLCFGCSRKSLNKALGRDTVDKHTLSEIQHFYLFININAFNRWLGFKIGEQKNKKYIIYNALQSK